MKSGPKYGNIFGIGLDSTSIESVLNFVDLKLTTKEKFYIVTPNPEIMLASKKDWLLKEALKKADLAIPDGIGLKFAYKLLNGGTINIIKGRELFINLIKLADKKSLKVFLVGGEHQEAEKTIRVLTEKYKKVILKTYRTPVYDAKGHPVSEQDKKTHKMLLSSIKMFEPDLVFVGLGAPKQEAWIIRYFFRLNVLGAMTVGGTFNYVAGNSKLPPKLFSNLGLEWLWRLLTEPKRLKRVLNAVILFPIEILRVKFFKK